MLTQFLDGDDLEGVYDVRTGFPHFQESSIQTLINGKEVRMNWFSFMSQAFESLTGRSRSELNQ